jgi:hypothetical protein
MSTLWLSAALLLSSVAPPAYKTYHNDRFGFRIDYPAALRPQPEADNGDGRRFVSADGQTTLAAYASYSVLDGGLADYQRRGRPTSGWPASTGSSNTPPWRWTRSWRAASCCRAR